MSARISGAEHSEEPTGADRVAGSAASALPSSMEPHAGATSGPAGRSRTRPLVMFNYHTLQRYSGKPSGISSSEFEIELAGLASFQIGSINVIQIVSQRGFQECGFFSSLPLVRCFLV